MLPNSFSFAGIPALPANFGLAPTSKPVNMSVAPNMSVVPAKAPTNQTSTSSPQTTPTAVVSSAPAAKDVSNLSSTVDDASTAIDTQAAIKTATAAAASATPAVKPTVQEQTPEQQVLNQPDAGNMFVYDKATGTRTQIPTTQPLSSSQTMTDVNNAGAADSVTIGNTEYRSFGNGDYGMYDTTSGKYLGAANAQNFADAKGVNQAQRDLQSIKNGTYPLTAGQQAQVDQMNQYYSGLIAAQQTENANVTGNVTGLQNLFGVGGTSVGMSEINKSIADGQKKIANIDNEMVTKVAALKAAIQNDQVNLVRELAGGYQDGVDKKQKEIDTLQATLASAAAKKDQDQATINDYYAKKYPDVTSPILPDDSADQMATKLATSPKYVQDTKIAQNLTTDENNFWADMATSGVSLSGILPNLGIGAAAAQAKLQIMKTIADNATKLGLSAQDVANGILDKKSKAATIMKLQSQGSQLAAQEAKVESDFNLVKQAGAKVPANVVQSGVPLLQNWINTGTLKTTSNAALNNYLGLLTTSLTNYARVVAGQTGSSGTTANMNTEIQNLIDKGLDIAAVNSYIDNAAIPEMKNTVSGYNDTMKSLTSSMNQADGTLNASVTEGGLGIDQPASTGQAQTNSDGTLSAVSF